MNNQKILITGASGFIGKNLKLGLEKKFNVLAPDSKTLNLLDSYSVKRYLSKNNFHTIIHCATHNATVTSTKNLREVISSNLGMFVNLTRCQNSFERMFYFGSGAEYDMRHYIPKMKEEYFDSHVPVDDYGFSKYIMAKYVEKSNKIFDLRLFGCFGKYEDYRIRFISNAICKTVFNMDITMYKNVYFDYLYIDDLIGIMKLFVQKNKLNFNYYNVCTGKSIDLFSIAKIIKKTSGKNLKIKIAEKGYKKEYSGSNKRLITEFGQIKFTPLEQSIRELLQWYEEDKKSLDKKQLI